MRCGTLQKVHAAQAGEPCCPLRRGPAGGAKVRRDRHNLQTKSAGSATCLIVLHRTGRITVSMQDFDPRSAWFLSLPTWGAHRIVDFAAEMRRRSRQQVMQQLRRHLLRGQQRAARGAQQAHVALSASRCIWLREAAAVCIAAAVCVDWCFRCRKDLVAEVSDVPTDFCQRAADQPLDRVEGVLLLPGRNLVPNQNLVLSRLQQQHFKLYIVVFFGENMLLLIADTCGAPLYMKQQKGWWRCRFRLLTPGLSRFLLRRLPSLMYPGRSRQVRRQQRVAHGGGGAWRRQRSSGGALAESVVDLVELLLGSARPCCALQRHCGPSKQPGEPLGTASFGTQTIPVEDTCQRLSSLRSCDAQPALPNKRGSAPF